MQVCRTDADMQRAQAAWAAYGASCLDPGSLYKPGTQQRSITSFFGKVPVPKVPVPGVPTGTRQGTPQGPGPSDAPAPERALGIGPVSSGATPATDEERKGQNNGSVFNAATGTPGGTPALNGTSAATGTLAAVGTCAGSGVTAAVRHRETRPFSKAGENQGQGKPVVDALATLMREGQRAYHAHSSGHESPNSKARGSCQFFPPFEMVMLHPETSG